MVWGGALSPHLDLDQVFKQGKATCAQVHVCAYVHSCVWGEVGGDGVRAHTLCFTCFLLFPVCCWLRGSPHCFASPCAFSFSVSRLFQFCQSPSPSLPPSLVSHLFSHPPPPTPLPIRLISLCPLCPAHLFCHLYWTSVPCSPAFLGFSVPSVGSC